MGCYWNTLGYLTDSRGVAAGVNDEAPVEETTISGSEQASCQSACSVRLWSGVVFTDSGGVAAVIVEVPVEETTTSVSEQATLQSAGSVRLWWLPGRVFESRCSSV